MPEGVTHIGNTTHLLVWDGVRVLTDPWVKDPADHITQHRVAPAPLPVDVDLVLVTHEHDDHFDQAALALIDKRATLVLPVWLADRAKAFGFADVKSVKAGDALSVNGVHLDVVHAAHSCDEVTYVLGRSGRRVYFGGDSLLTPEINAIAPVDLAILPADAGALLGTRRVMSTDEAVQLGARLGQRALLTHHEYELTSSVWSVIAEIPGADVAKLPPWFHAPKPGEAIAWPWMEST
jgi:L-ascorbate metabolism protein UlaG (beta-lactamase superfamily)